MGKHVQWRSPNPRSPKSYGETVRYGGRSDGGDAYLAHSDRVGPGVLVLHEGYGLQPAWIGLADRLTADGFTVLVPDLFDGRVADAVDEARALGGKLDRHRTARRLAAAVEFLRDNWHPRVGILGFSMGAMLGFELAARGFGDALVAYYGMPDEALSRVECPVLVHLAEADELMPNGDAEAAFDAMGRSGTDIETIRYAGAHSFANSSVAAFDQTAAEEAFATTCAFFHHHLA